jgi:hypothetical protein
MSIVVRRMLGVGCPTVATNGSRLCEAVDFEKQKFNKIKKFNICTKVQN